MVRLKAATLAWMEALAEGDDELTARFDIPVGAGWAGCPEAMPAALHALRADPGPETPRRRTQADPRPPA